MPYSPVPPTCTCGLPWGSVTPPPPCAFHGLRYDRHADAEPWRRSVAITRRLLARILACSYLGVTDAGASRLYLERDWIDLTRDEAAYLALLDAGLPGDNEEDEL